MYIERDGISEDEVNRAFKECFGGGGVRKVLLVPPDDTRSHSGAGMITFMLYKLFTSVDAAVDIMPAIGTHVPMTEERLRAFFGEIPTDFLTHNWRDGVSFVGEIPGDFVRGVSEGLMDSPIPVEVSSLLLDASYDLILSIGQVVPHEVAGMANYSKNILVGCGGSRFISSSHMLGAFYGIERILGTVDTPVRKLFDYAEERFLAGLPLVYVLTVTETIGGETRMRGLYIGGGREGFERAAALSQKCNITKVEKPIETCVVWLSDREFHSTWLGNKAIYRTRKAICDGGRLIILAPGVREFGEDAEIDRLIRKYGYVGRESVLSLCKTEGELQNNLSAAAHLIHGSSDGRFEITYAAPFLGREAVEGVGYKYADLTELLRKYNPETLKIGYNALLSGEEIYYIPNPAVGLWF